MIKAAAAGTSTIQQKAISPVPNDLTFLPDCAYASPRWVAMRLGKSVDWMRKNTGKLKIAGFPDQDPLFKTWLKEDVEAWLNKRRKVSEVRAVANNEPLKENLHVL